MVVGSNPSATTTQPHSSVGERRPYKASVGGSNPPVATNSKGEEIMLKRYKAWLHSSKDDAYEYNKSQALGMDEESDAFDNFRYSLYEVEFDMEVDTTTGETKILAVDGIRLEQATKYSI